MATPNPHPSTQTGDTRVRQLAVRNDLLLQRPNNDWTQLTTDEDGKLFVDGVEVGAGGGGFGLQDSVPFDPDEAPNWRAGQPVFYLGTTYRATVDAPSGVPTTGDDGPINPDYAIVAKKGDVGEAGPAGGDFTDDTGWVCIEAGSVEVAPSTLIPLGDEYTSENLGASLTFDPITHTLEIGQSGRYRISVRVAIGNATDSFSEMNLVKVDNLGAPSVYIAGGNMYLEDRRGTEFTETIFPLFAGDRLGIYNSSGNRLTTRSFNSVALLVQRVG